MMFMNTLTIMMKVDTYWRLPVHMSTELVEIMRIKKLIKLLISRMKLRKIITELRDGVLLALDQEVTTEASDQVEDCWGQTQWPPWSDRSSWALLLLTLRVRCHCHRTGTVRPRAEDLVGCFYLSHPKKGKCLILILHIFSHESDSRITNVR